MTSRTTGAVSARPLSRTINRNIDTSVGAVSTRDKEDLLHPGRRSRIPTGTGVLGDSASHGDPPFPSAGVAFEPRRLNSSRPSAQQLCRCRYVRIDTTTGPRHEMDLNWGAASWYACAQEGDPRIQSSLGSHKDEVTTRRDSAGRASSLPHACGIALRNGLRRVVDRVCSPDACARGDNAIHGRWTGHRSAYLQAFRLTGAVAGRDGERQLFGRHKHDQARLSPAFRCSIF